MSRRKRAQRRGGGAAARGRQGGGPAPRVAGRRVAPSPWRQARVPITLGIALLLLLILWYTGYTLSKASATTSHRSTVPTPAAAAASALAPPTPDSRPPTSAPKGSAFDGDAAFQRVKEQCDFGPRVPGTDGHAKCRAYLVSALKATTSRVEEQTFTFRDGSRDVPMVNLIARFPGTASREPRAASGVLIAAHWDTRPTADQEPDLARRRQPIPGANDGASGVAVLVELARMLKAKAPAVPVWLVLFDGEDYGPGLDRMFLGAKHFAAHLPEGCPPKGVLLDMIGDRDLEVFKEVNSMTRAGAVVQSLWETARRLGYEKQFNPATRYTIEDDHIPLLDKGIAMIDVIDFDFPYWHTLGDTVDKCAPKSLRVIGDVVAAWIYDHRS